MIGFLFCFLFALLAIRGLIVVDTAVSRFTAYAHAHVRSKEFNDDMIGKFVTWCAGGNIGPASLFIPVRIIGWKISKVSGLKYYNVEIPENYGPITIVHVGVDQWFMPDHFMFGSAWVRASTCQLVPSDDRGFDNATLSKSHLHIHIDGGRLTANIGGELEPFFNEIINRHGDKIVHFNKSVLNS